MKKTLTATELKIIAIIAMVIDHTAWGFVEMFSVPGQIMHVIGRFTIPIMSFFLAEGYRKTSNVKNYVLRMATFAVATVIPFYLFFGEEYGYRQNFIFDLLLALLVLVVTDHKTMKKPLKVLLTVLLFAVSLLIGGWPVFPMVGALIFFYIKDFRKQAIVYGSSVVFLVAFMAVTIWCSNTYGWGLYDESWVWYQWFYFLGFVLPLPLLARYNGQKGEYPIGRYFFFIFYPVHFLVLYFIKLVIACNVRYVFIGLHLTCVALTFFYIISLMNAKPSKAVISSCVLAVAGLIYMFGFVLEVVAGSLDIAFAATIVEYFGECLVLIAFMWFMSEFCQVKIHALVYTTASVVAVLIMYLVMSSKLNHVFYKSLGMNTDGPFPRLELEYGPGFALFNVYAALICISVIVNCINLIRNSKDELVEKRARYMLMAICCPWLAFAVKLTGITGGYEISSVGCLGAIFCIYRAVLKYGFFDSVQLAAENAIHKFGEGILVTDPNHVIKYMNQSMQELFPKAKEGIAIGEVKTLSRLLDKDKVTAKIYDRKYEFEVTPLLQSDYLQGYMITSKDMTDHFAQLEQAERYAQRDALTGLYNRVYFAKQFEKHRNKGGLGCLVMLDLDNFKGVNDTLGHEVGDKILIAAADTLTEVSGKQHICGRLGGDEYIMYIRDEIDSQKIGEICQSLQSIFAQKISEQGFELITSMSIGGKLLTEAIKIDSAEDFAESYRAADKMLYESKKSGKSTYRIG